MWVVYKVEPGYSACERNETSAGLAREKREEGTH